MCLKRFRRLGWSHKLRKVNSAYQLFAGHCLSAMQRIFNIILLLICSMNIEAIDICTVSSSRSAQKSDLSKEKRT